MVEHDIRNLEWDHGIITQYVKHMHDDSKFTSEVCQVDPDDGRYNSKTQVGANIRNQ